MKMDLILKIIAVVFIVSVVYSLVMPLRIFKRKQYDKFPHLKDSVTAEQYEIVPLESDIVYAITYDPRNNYFILSYPEYFTKLNALGHEVARIPRTEKSELPRFSQYVFVPEGVYDMANGQVKLERFTTIINPDRSEDAFKLRDILKPLYEQADIVLFSQELPYADGAGYCVYFKIHGAWTKLFLEKRGSQLNVADLYAENERPEGYRSRYAKLVPLKDPDAGVYSDHREDGDWYLVDPADYRYEYESRVKLKTLYYEREYSFWDLPFTSIPVSWVSQAYYRLTYKDNEFYFQEKTVKNLLMPIRHYYHMLEIPKAYQSQSDVWFLVLDDPFNVTDSGSKGTHLVRRRIKK